MELLTDPQIWIALLTLTALEIVLGIDNVVFISILAGKLPPEEQKRARTVGLGLAMFMRIALLFSLSWVIGLTDPLFAVLDKDYFTMPADQLLDNKVIFTVVGDEIMYTDPEYKPAITKAGK